MFSRSMLLTHFLLILPILAPTAGKSNIVEIEEWAELLKEELRERAKKMTRLDEIVTAYEADAVSETFDPETEIEKMKNDIEKYLETRAKLAWNAKLSLENKDMKNESSTNSFNDPNSDDFITFYDSLYANTTTVVYTGNIEDPIITVPAKPHEFLNFTPNANMYNLSTDGRFSTVQVSTPVYKRTTEILRQIDWSNIDDIFRGNRQAQRDLGWQFFCGSTGFYRYYPSAPWAFDNPDSQLDLYDCRNSQWYIDGSSNAKNIIIMLDMSGSMLGQKYEIAKQTIEAIMETLSENDFFNVMWFSKEINYLDGCYSKEEPGLLQATLRNKKMVRHKLENITSEEIAIYPPALTQAFTTLYNLNVTPHISAPDWVAKDNKDLHQAPPTRADYSFRTADGFLIQYNQSFFELVSEASGKMVGCHNAIMLITDGASETHEELFKLYNKNKTVRFFSYLIGNEATEFWEVRWMACFNRGFMVHIANMADVHEKVQEYIKVLSRPIAAKPEMASETQPIWTGVYYDKLGLRMVTTVAYPVVYNSSFMGVVGVTVPLLELSQLAPTWKLGQTGYSFMVDNNGYVMFHPQLRPLHLGMPKPNYNNMDILELEVVQENEMTRAVKTIHIFIEDKTKPTGQRMDKKKIPYWTINSKRAPSQQREPSNSEADDTLANTTLLDYDNELRKNLVDGRSSKGLRAESANILLALEDVRHVYKQSHQYYYRGVENTFFSIGIAVPVNSRKRLASKDIQLLGLASDWVKDDNWRLHPYWRYCLLNDSDWHLSREEAFRLYALDMSDTGVYPKLCEARREVVNRLMLDVFALRELSNGWQLPKNDLGIHMVYVATESGFTRFEDGLDGRIVYEDPYTAAADSTSGKDNATGNATEESTKKEKTAMKAEPMPPYDRFNEINVQGPDEIMYKRAMLMRKFPRRFVYDVDLQNAAYFKQESTSVYGVPEKRAIFVKAAAAIEYQQAPIGVVGFEMLYDDFALAVQVTGRNHQGCENGKDTDVKRCYLLDEHGYVVYSSRNISYDAHLSQNLRLRRGSVLRKFFGQIGREEEVIFRKLVDEGLFEKFTYVNYQDMCFDNESVNTATRVLSPLYSLLRTLRWLWRELSTLIIHYGLLNYASSVVMPAEAYTSTFRGVDKSFACDKAKFYYLLNEERGATKVSEDSCEQCAVEAVAAPVRETNLLLVRMELLGQCESESCLKEPLSEDKRVHWGFEMVHAASDKAVSAEDDGSRAYGCRAVTPRYRRAPTQCWEDPSDSEKDFPCSRAARLPNGFCFVITICTTALLLFLRLPYN